MQNIKANQTYTHALTTLKINLHRALMTRTQLQLDETFSIVRNQFGEVLTVDLKANGRCVDLIPHFRVLYSFTHVFI